MNIILIGFPCSGKGTQSQIISKKYKLQHISTGQILRNIIKYGKINDIKNINNEALNQQYNKLKTNTNPNLTLYTKIKYIKECMNKGVLVDSDTISDITLMYIDENNIIERITSNDISGVIFDGFPRNILQIKKLETISYNLKFNIDIIINLIVSEDVIIQRLHKRSLLESRSDDNISIIKNRIKIYKEDIKKMNDYYLKQGKIIHNINGDDSINKVSLNIINLLSQNYQHSIK